MAIGTCKMCKRKKMLGKGGMCADCAAKKAGK